MPVELYRGGRVITEEELYSFRFDYKIKNYSKPYEAFNNLGEKIVHFLLCVFFFTSVIFEFKIFL